MIQFALQFLALVTWSFINFSYLDFSSQVEKKDLIPPPPNLENFTAGFSIQLADVMWIRSIQDLDFCENEIAKQRCKGNSWLYQMLNTVTQLDPNYRIPYALGAIALSVVISDIEGASALFDKGVIHFPKDWKILYRAGYHALLEEKNNLKAAERFDKAADYGAPKWLKGLAGRLYNKEGREEDVGRLIEELSSSEENKWIAERMKQRIQKGE
jgi:hypothetical protein